jgi:hypothetical protein
MEQPNGALTATRPLTADEVEAIKAEYMRLYPGRDAGGILWLTDEEFGAKANAMREAVCQFAEAAWAAIWPVIERAAAWYKSLPPELRAELERIAAQHQGENAQDK